MPHDQAGVTRKITMCDHDGKCQRCGTPTGATIMSRFNTDILCLPCHTLEMSHPDFTRARDTEHEAVVRGDYNFPGVGLPQGYTEWAARQMTGEG